MIKGIDHLVLPTGSKEQAEAIAEKLLAEGLLIGGRGDSGDHGASNILVALEGGGFIELTWEHAPGSAPFPGLFRATPRVAGIGFTSTNIEEDGRAWSDLESAWLWERDWTDDTGQKKGYRANGPFPVGEAYLFLMEGDRFPYDDVGARGKLVEIAFSGGEHELWEKRYRTLLDLEWEDGVARTGWTRISFAPGDNPRLEARLRIDVPGEGGSIDFAEGGIDLVPISA